MAQRLLISIVHILNKADPDQHACTVRVTSTQMPLQVPDRLKVSCVAYRQVTAIVHIQHEADPNEHACTVTMTSTHMQVARQDGE